MVITGTVPVIMDTPEIPGILVKENLLTNINVENECRSGLERCSFFAIFALPILTTIKHRI